MIPAAVSLLIEDGKKQLAAQRQRRIEEVKKQEQMRQKDEIARTKKSWAYLCVEAGVDLELVERFVNWRMPIGWKPPEKTQWLFINIPGLTEVVAEYEIFNVFEWRLARWAVAGYTKRGFNGIAKHWVTFEKSDYGLDYVLALAAEENCHKQLLQQLTDQKTIKIADVRVEEVEDCETVHQAVS